jgi:type I restriction enzyme S subunit
MSSLVPDGWLFSKIGDAVISSSGGVSVNSENRPATVNELGILKTSSVVDGRFYPAEHKAILSDEVGRVSIRPKKNHILFSRMNTPLLVGQSGFVERDYEHLFLPDRLWQIEVADKFNPKWLSYVLRSQKVVKLITDAATGTSNTMKNIAKPNLMAIPMMSPPLPEQQKIAQILTSVDEVIEKTQAQIDKLKDLKTGMMQELLTKGIGHVEFKDSPVGSIPVGWEVVTMRDICVTRQGLQIPISSRYSEPAENRFIYLTIKFINTGFNPAVAQYIENPSKRVICNEDDIILARTGATGKVVTGVSGVFHNNFFMVDYNRRKIKRNYLVQYLNSPYIQTEIKNRAGTTTIPDLNHGDFYSLPMLIPPMDEQSKIAEVLVSYDNLILNKTKKLNAIISTKKALMQDLLTGKVRVNTEQPNSALAVG